MKHLLKMGCMTVLLVSLQANAQFWNTAGNNVVGTDYLGAALGSTVPLQLKTVGILPIDFYTTNTFRMRLNPTVTYPTLNGLSSIPADGFALLSPNANFLASAPYGPFSRLHLADGTYDTQNFGYRPWQRNGVTFTGNNDQAYVGHKYGVLDQSDMVIQWSDNPGFTKADRMRFIFTSQYQVSPTSKMNSLEGLEAMRFWPKDGNNVNVGIGDFASAGADPLDRLDISDGSLRIRQLPNESPFNSLTKVMVVDNNGVVKWREGNSFLCTSGWSLQGNNAVTAFNGNACPPQTVDAVGIGTNLSGGAAAKLNVRATTFNTGVQVDVINTGNAFGAIINSAGNGASVRGVQVTTSGTSTVAHAGDFISNDASPTALGALGEATAGSFYSQGVTGRSRSNGTYNLGVVGESRSSGTSNVGVYASQGTGSFINPPIGNIGVFASSQNQDTTISTNWAGYFRGNVMVTGAGVIPGGVWSSSDENIKENITDLPNGLEVITQLNPKSYDYQADALPQVGLPAGQQYGFLAQELEQVIPEAVKDITYQTQLDSVGQVVYPAVSSKIVNTATVIPFHVAAVKEQQATIDQQNTRMAELEDRINQCCAANGNGMAPQNGERSTSAESNVQEQRLLIIPNPVADLTTLEYYVPKAGQVSLQVSTNDGKPVEVLREEKAEAGAYNYAWNTTKLAAGTYFCTFMLDGAVVVKRAVKVK